MSEFTLLVLGVIGVISAGVAVWSMVALGYALCTGAGGRRSFLV